MSACAAFLAVLATAVLLCSQGAEAEYTVDTALSALRFSKAAYCEPDVIKRWDCCFCGANSAFQTTTVISRKEWGMQVFYGVSSSHIVVAFRGSQNSKNWVTNLDSARIRYTNTNCTDCTVHGGFLSVYSLIIRYVLLGVMTLINAYQKHSVLVTGHSLGGALATLAAADIAYLRYASGAAPHIELYTFGSPRMGNQAFADWFAWLFGSGGHESYRVTHTRDIVPHVPPAFAKYVHVPNEVWYNNDNETGWTNCTDVSKTADAAATVTEDPTCSNSGAALSTADHSLYLGMSTSCSCDPDADAATDMLEPSAEPDMTALADYVYRHALGDAALQRRQQTN